MAPATSKPSGVVGSTETQVTTSSDHEFAGNQDMAHLAGKVRPIADIERESIEAAIAQCDGNIRNAAALLGISSPTIYLKKAVWNGAQPAPPAQKRCIRINLCHETACIFQTTPDKRILDISHTLGAKTFPTTLKHNKFN